MLFLAGEMMEITVLLFERTSKASDDSFVFQNFKEKGLKAQAQSASVELRLDLRGKVWETVDAEGRGHNRGYVKTLLSSLCPLVPLRRREARSHQLTA